MRGSKKSLPTVERRRGIYRWCWGGRESATGLSEYALGRGEGRGAANVEKQSTILPTYKKKRGATVDHQRDKGEETEENNKLLPSLNITLA